MKQLKTLACVILGIFGCLCLAMDVRAAPPMEVISNDILMPSNNLRIYNKEVAVEVTWDGPFAWEQKVFHTTDRVPGTPKQWAVVSTRVDKYYGAGDKIFVKYLNVGEYQGRPVDIKVQFTFSGLTSIERLGRWEQSLLYLNETGGEAFKDRAKFTDGIRYSSAPRVHISYEILEAGTSTRIIPDFMYFTWGSLNKGEGVHSMNTTTTYYKIAGAQPEVHDIYDGWSSSDVFITSSNLSMPAPGSDVSYWMYGNQTRTFLMNPYQTGFYDSPDSDTFWKSMGTMKCTSANGLYHFEMLTYHYWFTPMIGAVGATAPEPEKFIDDNGRNVTSVTRNAGDAVDFKIQQPVQTFGYYGTGYQKYSNFSFEDTLEAGLSYEGAEVYRIYGSNVSDVTSQGTLAYDADTRKVTFSFPHSYLQGGMTYAGETYELRIHTKLLSTAPVTVKNKASTVICNTRLMTNEVSITHHKWKITTEVVNGTITPDITNIPGGSEKTVSYAPDAGHYLESVTVDGTAVNIGDYPDSYTFSNIQADHTIKVVYAPCFTITTKVTNGTITPKMTGIKKGEAKTITYTPNAGHYLESVTVDGTAVSITSNADEYTFSNISADHDIKVVYAPYWKVTTEVVNGTITPDDLTIKKGENRTVSYAPKSSDYYLKSITVDGTALTKAQLVTYRYSYSFTNISADHHVKVVYAKVPVITITKQLEREVIWAKGSPEFSFTITGTDYLGNARTYHRTITFSENDETSKSVTLKIPAGTWTVSELAANDWSLSRVTAGSSCTVSGNTGIINTLEAGTGSVTFANRQSDWSDYTENQTMVNRLK